MPGTAQNPIRKESHKEGPACGRMPYELPTAGGRIPYGRAFGKKDLIQTGTAQDPIRRDPACGGIPYEIGCLPYKLKIE